MAGCYPKKPRYSVTPQGVPCRGIEGEGIRAAGIMPDGIPHSRRKRLTVTRILREWRNGTGNEETEGKTAAAAIERLAARGDPAALRFWLDNAFS